MSKVSASEWLATGWLLVHDPENRGRDEKWFLGIPEERAVEATVPSFVHMYLPDCPGIAWYQKRFNTGLCLDEDHMASLHFEMADFLCEVYLNGTYIGTHRGTENPFSFDVSAALKTDGENLLAVRVSKPYTEPVDGYTFWEIPHRNQAPAGLKPGWCYNEYGLSGRVSLSILPRLRMTDLYLYCNTETACIDVQCTIVNEYAQEVEAKLSMLAGDKRTGMAEVEDEYAFAAPVGESVLRRSLPVGEVRLWDLDDPNLYFVNAELSCAQTTHVLHKRSGFRTFKVGEDGYFYLNGRRIFLRCSHTGNCMPESTHHLSRDKSLLRKDFTMAKSTGFNMVRFISGAALPEQLDMCDELGLMVYEEPVSSWLQQDGPRAKELYQYDLLTMVKRDRSHACVTIWGLLNETTAKPPFKDCCFIARESLGDLRELDETRLVLYSSGRWDNDASVGSMANPFSRKWEYLWDGEKEDGCKEVAHVDPDPGSTKRGLGDKHHYPSPPHCKHDTNFLRTVGYENKRPVFVSEYGVGSLFDVLWLQRKFEENGADQRMPDVAMVNRMAEQFLNDLKAYDMEGEYAFPIDIMRCSQQMHNRHRSVGFDILRSNPYMCGVSLTGLLDHSICGEGLWTLMREWKPGIADTLQDGFAPLRWCLFTSDTNVYAGRPFTIEGVLANEDVLKEQEYPVCVRIVGEEGVVYEEYVTLNVTAEAMKGLSLPVFKREITLNVPEGKYTLRAEILKGAAATDGDLEFYVCADEKAAAAVPEVVAIGIGEEAEKLLRRKGVRLIAPEEVSAPAVVLMGDLAEEEKEAAWATVRGLLEKGCRVVVGSRFALMKEENTTFYLPLEQKLVHEPARRGSTDWLYHKEYLAKRNHPYFKDLPTGLMDWYYYMQLTCGAYFRDAEDGKAEDVAACCFCTGQPNDEGYSGGMSLAAYKAGNGMLILNTFRIMENLNINPAADRMLLNILNAEYAAL